MSRYVLTNIARADLEEIADYIAQDDPDAAMRILEDFRTAMERLADMPQARPSAARLGR